MNCFPRKIVPAFLWLCLAHSVLAQPVVINEIMYHPFQAPLGAEPVGEEFIELYNRSGTNVNLNGWRFNKGISFTFTNVTLAPNAYLVVSADVAIFSARYPTVTNVVGNWSGTLGNNGETIEIKDADGQVVDSVSYGTEGDWAQRRRAALDVYAKRGWEWYSPADGLGKTMELRNPNLGNGQGQNWAASGPTGGTPGRVNSVFTNNVAPLILNLSHSPLVPKSFESVAITAFIFDELTSGLGVTLFWRVDSPSPSAINSAAMFDDGAHGDGAAGDGVYGAIIPARPNNSVIEFYVQAADSTGHTNLWPAPALAATDQPGPATQTVNALYQVDDDPLNAYGGVSATQPIYKLIMTESERAELASIPCSGAQNSDEEMNGTFLTFDGIGVEFRYRAGFRNRGHGSRCATPPNYRVNIANDNRWKGKRALNLNTVNTPAQIFAATIAKKAGLTGADSLAAQVRVNNVNRASTGTGMLSAYASNEEMDGDWAGEHFPLDSAGNIYRAIRDISPSEWNWRGTNVSSYVNTYFKTDNTGANDWSDLVNLHRITGTNDLFTTANVRQVVNVEQWMTYFAVMALSGNGETSPNIGYNDDYFMYRGENDPRFLLVYYDNDTVYSSAFGARSTSDPIFGMEANNGIGQMTTRFVEWPDFKPIYYTTLQRLLDTAYSQAQFDAVVDEVFSTYPPSNSLTSVINGIKSWMSARRSFVQSAINGLVPPAANNPIATVSGEPRSPTPFSSARLTVGGAGITHYRSRLNGGAFGAETPIATAITLSGLANGSTNTIYVIGKNSAGTYQNTTNPTVSRTWIVKTSTPAVRLNEILARNDSAVNANGTFPDIIELFNEGAATVDLSGLRLTDDPADPNKFTFATNTTLAAGSYLVAFANNDDGSPGIHLGFSLDQDGDGVYLFDKVSSSGALLDSVVYGLQVPDKSIGRFNDGDWGLTQPSFGSTNVAQSLGNPATLKINEWLTSGTLPYVDDFIEVYNPSALPVAIGGFYMTDEPIGAPALHRILSLSFMGGGAHTAFIADGNASGGANHLNFSLSSELGEIGLNAADLTKIDTITYGPQRTGVAQGRCPEGGTAIVFLSTPTPGSPNICPEPPPTAQLVNIIPVTNVWRYNQMQVDLGTAWKEVIYNDETNWPSGPGLMGRPRNAGQPTAYIPPDPILTPLLTNDNRTTFYFRTHFTVSSQVNFTSLQFSNLCDDGAVFYLNGKDVGRIRMTSSPATPLYSTLADSIQDAPWTGPTRIELTNLVAGDNVFAVEVHQASITSQDIMFGLRLDGVIITNSASAAGLVLNEVLANNATIREADGTTPDWVEIHNPSATAVDLGDMSLSDSTLDARRWVFPSPTILPAQSYLVVRFDGGLPVSATNSGFGLKSSGDSVYLFKKMSEGGGVLDFINFGFQTEDFSIGRYPAGSTNWVLTVPSAGSPNTVTTLGSAANLKVNEWLAAPASGSDWFEIYNPNPQPVAMGGLWLSDDLTSSTTRQQYRIPALSFIGSITNAYQKFIADGNVGAGADHVNFSLKASGEAVGISTAAGTLIDGINFGVQAVDVSEGRLPDGSTNIVAFINSPSPGEANYYPLTNIVFSELLTHTDPPLEDAIELQNISAGSLDISGWYLSDAKGNLKKYLIPNGVSIAPGQFKTFYEAQFNDPNFPLTAFALSSSKGDQVYLSQATANGGLTGYRASIKFGAAENGVSFGRYPTTLGVDFVAMSRRTFGVDSPLSVEQFRMGTGLSNAYPKIGPVVISEIMYHPPNIGTNDNVAHEFIELFNITSNTVPLYTPAYPTNTWRLRDGIDFDFPLNTSLPAFGHLLVVSFDPSTNASALASFRNKYGSNAVILGPYSGKLDNGSESLELFKPDPPQLSGPNLGFVPYVLVERVKYADSGAWPTNADGYGSSLQRIDVNAYGNEPTNWTAAAPTAGAPLDSDGDGMPDYWEIAYGFQRNNAADANLDADGDGLTNLQEYLLGSDPRVTQNLRVQFVSFSGGTVQLQFEAIAGKPYTMQYRDSLTSGTWQTLSNISAQPTSQSITITDSPATNSAQRFYQLVAP